MKKLLMIVALVGLVFTGYSKTNESSINAQAQKPSITLSVSGSGFFKTITVHASQPVPEAVACDGHYQAPGNVTGYWSITLSPGETSASASYDITEDNMADIVYISAGGKFFNVDMSSGPCETAAAIYYVNY